MYLVALEPTRFPRSSDRLTVVQRWTAPSPLAASSPSPRLSHPPAGPVLASGCRLRPPGFALHFPLGPTSGDALVERLGMRQVPGMAQPQTASHLMAPSPLPLGPAAGHIGPDRTPAPFAQPLPSSAAPRGPRGRAGPPHPNPPNRPAAAHWPRAPFPSAIAPAPPRLGRRSSCSLPGCIWRHRGWPVP